MLRKMAILLALALVVGVGRFNAQSSTAPGREIQLGLRWAF